MWCFLRVSSVASHSPQASQAVRLTFFVSSPVEYRGTQVAVKRVIPPKSGKSKDEKLDGLDDGNDIDSRSGHGNSTVTSSVGMQSGMASGLGTNSGIGTASTLMGQSPPQNAVVQRKRMKQEFIEEMRYLSKLRHPCVTTIMGAVLGDDPMLVME